LSQQSSSSASKLIVQKYGGTSVGSIERIKHIAGHIADTVRSGHQVVAVISAMGDQTDELLAMAHSISRQPPRRELDMLLTAGERISMALVSIALNDLGQKAVSLTGSQSGIITDTVHGNARISRIGAFRIQDSLSAGNVAIVAGFQGVSAETKEITTLGRGGSDLSAIALAASLGARSCQLYKDVDGVCSADPRIVTEAKVLENIAWDAMTEMAWAGASVLHPRGAHLAAKFGIPLEIRSSFNLRRKGTVVSGREVMEQVVVNAVTHKLNMVILRGTLPREEVNRLDELRSWLWQQGESSQIQVQIDTKNGLEFCCSLQQSLLEQARQRLAVGSMSQSNLETIDCGLISVIGSGFWQSPETLDTVRKITPDALFFDVKNSCLTLAVSPEKVERVVKSLHNSLIS
jgi:aspartate kinase